MTWRIPEVVFDTSPLYVLGVTVVYITQTL